MGNRPGPATAVRPAEPTLGIDTGYDTYLWPHSKTPRKDALYQRLRALGWRYEPTIVEFHTPEGQTFQARGRLATNVELTEAWIHPPIPEGQEPSGPLGLHMLPSPILVLQWINEEWHVTQRRTA